MGVARTTSQGYSGGHHKDMGMDRNPRACGPRMDRYGGNDLACRTNRCTLDPVPDPWEALLNERLLFAHLIHHPRATLITRLNGTPTLIQPRKRSET